jgi:hypothetical protein
MLDYGATKRIAPKTWRKSKPTARKPRRIYSEYSRNATSQKKPARVVPKSIELKNDIAFQLILVRCYIFDAFFNQITTTENSAQEAPAPAHAPEIPCSMNVEKPI